MQILIQQDRSSLRPAYRIDLPRAHFVAESERFLSHAKIVVKDSETNIIASIKRKFTFFKINYDINIGFKKYKLLTKTFCKPTYLCSGDLARYEIIEHNKLKYSIFQGRAQIGAFVKKRVSIGAADIYELFADNDADHLLFVCIVLALDNATNDGTYSASVTVDYGRLFGELKPFDENWRPK